MGIKQFYKRPMALRIKELREAKGWTQDDLARRANISRSHISMIESEARPVNTLKLSAIAAALDVTPEELFVSGDEDSDSDYWRIAKIMRDLSAEDRSAIVRIAESLAAKADNI